MTEAEASNPASRRYASRLAYTNRLAELVVHLTDCSPERAIEAVEAAAPVDPVSPDDALEVVARAIVTVRHVDLRDQVDLREATARPTSIS
jgi:chemotaxis regulatin CheY-phosphate phosphatase CheZ